MVRSYHPIASIIVQRFSVVVCGSVVAVQRTSNSYFHTYSTAFYRVTLTSVVHPWVVSLRIVESVSGFVVYPQQREWKLSVRHTCN